MALLLLGLPSSSFCAEMAPPFPAAALAHAQDYTLGYYPLGWRGRDPSGNILFAVETSRYGILVNAGKARVERLGTAAGRVSGWDAVSRDKDFVLSLPTAPLEFSLEVAGERYSADQAAPKGDSVVLERMGRYLQHFEIRDVAFHKQDGTKLEGVSAKIVFYCWADRFSGTLILTAERRLNDLALRAALTLPSARDLQVPGPNETWRAVEPPAVSDTFLAQDGSSGGFALLNSPSLGQALKVSSERTFEWETGKSALESGNSISVAAVVVPSPANVSDAAARSQRELQDPLPSGSITAEGISPYDGPLAVSDDAVRGWTRITLGNNPDIWKPERVHVKISNPTEFSRTLRLNFAKEGGGFGITGMSPVLRDLDGRPLGIPVQISKNWHCRPGWFSGLVMLELAPREKLEFEFTLVYAKWGGVPAVSHAQLCLDGYGGNQQWDEMAIGSFGESICYDPDINLGRSMVDDMRPLMVWGMGPKEKTQWSWTHNVGGADFLVLCTGGAGKPEKQFLASQKTLYASQGPVMSDVIYAGEALGGAVKSRVRARSWRTDDYVRALYSIRYDVRRETGDLQRIALFQLAADRYNENIFRKITRGDLAGEKETWEPETGGEKYSRRSLPLTGDSPWFALYEASKPPNIKPEDTGAWANRGLIVRSWKAKIRGADCPHPFYSIYGTGNGAFASALVELSPPPDTPSLLPGDYVEAEIEMLILPQRAQDYYGPNKLLVSALEAHPDHWNLVLREAAGSKIDLSCEAGIVEETLPIRIRAKDGRLARFRLKGGIGYTPITISGASRSGPFDLLIKNQAGEEKIDQSDLGNDWWQADYNPDAKDWALTFTLPLDELRGAADDLRFEWRLRD